jgi:hypothetical protein
MNYYHHHQAGAALLTLLSLSAVLAQTAGPALQAPVVAASETRQLSPAQLIAIRGISRNVLTAKKSGTEDAADAAQLTSLRASLDQVIAANIDPKNREPITLQGQESSAQRNAREKIVGLRESARSDARTIASQLRSRGEFKAAQARGQSEQSTRSAGLPIGEQRARLFERWAQKLDTALADDNADRADQLRALREQLRATDGRLSDAPITHGTPTLQAMPVGFVPPKNNGDNGVVKQ